MTRFYYRWALPSQTDMWLASRCALPAGIAKQHWAPMAACPNTSYRSDTWSLSELQERPFGDIVYGGKLCRERSPPSWTANNTNTRYISRA